MTLEPFTPRPPGLDPTAGTTRIPDRATFERLARRDDVPGALGVREVKFLLLGVDGSAPQLYFINTADIAYHYDFAVRGLGISLSLEAFNAQTYFRDDRTNLAGSIVAHDAFEESVGVRGLYALEFWPTDPVRVRHVALAFGAIAGSMPFVQDRLAYHPAGETQESLYRRDGAEFRRLGVRVVETTELFGDVAFSPLNLGVGFGMLRPTDPSRPATIRDVVIFRTLPNDLARVGGVISETPQTPLSHVNLKAKQNDTPNAYVREASSHPRVAPLTGRLVRYEVSADDFTLREASGEEAEAWLEALRPPHPQAPRRDLSVREVADLDALGFVDAGAYGAKAANVAELRKILPPGVVPDGYGLPFSFYDTFMEANGFYAAAERVMAEEAFRSDAAVRERRLGELRKQVRRGVIPPEQGSWISDLQGRFPASQPIRCRSSTNNEDVEGFNGAGLYDSYTHRPDEGNLGETLKQVWASLWNYRAFEEREFHRIDHRAAAMGVLVHPNFDDELSNGVAVTKNPFDPEWPGFYVNVQIGESLVTNPDPNAIPDELLISAIGPNREYETQYIRRSSLVPEGETVLTAEQTRELTRALEVLHRHFVRLYRREGDGSFAMDIEFKFDAQGSLVVKQARPWVD